VVYSEGSPRFDPNGLIAAMWADHVLHTGYEKKAVFVSLGQGDRAVSASRSQYKSAMKAVADYVTSRGSYCFFGMTIYSAGATVTDANAANTSSDAWYSAELMPGRVDALSEFSGNSLVKAGADLRTALGVLPVNPATGAGLQADNVHGNPELMVLAGVEWDRVLSLNTGF